MAWPTTITTDEDLRYYAMAQGVWRMLEEHNNFAAAHEAAANAVARALRARGTDPDAVTNTADFKTPALNYVLFMLFRIPRPDISERFLQGYGAEMKNTSPVTPTATTEDGGGQFAPVNVYLGGGRDRRGTGGRLFYRDRPGDSPFGRS